MLQILWLRDQKIASAAPADGQSTHLGSYLSPEAAEAGLNFLNPDIHLLALREMLLREEDAAYDEDRLIANSLSSMPLVFNAFGPLALDMRLASKVFRELFPGFVRSVENVRFETSPGRKDDRYLSDRSAADVALDIRTPQGERGIIFVEMKYSEDLSHSVSPTRWTKPRYEAALKEVRLFKNPASPLLRSAPIEQLTREHMLSQLAVDNGACQRALFVAIAPRLNRRCSAAFKIYANELLPVDESDRARVAFHQLTLEALIDAIDVAGDQDTADRLWQRYCNFQRVYDAALHVLAPKLSANTIASSSSGTSADARASAARKRDAPPNASESASTTEASADAQ